MDCKKKITNSKVHYEWTKMVRIFETQWKAERKRPMKLLAVLSPADNSYRMLFSSPTAQFFSTWEMTAASVRRYFFERIYQRQFCMCTQGVSMEDLEKAQEQTTAGGDKAGGAPTRPRLRVDDKVRTDDKENKPDWRKAEQKNEVSPSYISVIPVITKTCWYCKG